MTDSYAYKLAHSLVWSNQDFSFSEFVETYELPQVVRVEVGYCGVSERTTFSSGLILTLHSLQTTRKIICKVPHSNPILISTNCPVKAEVIPLDCSDSVVTAYQLSTLYKEVKYLRVMEVGVTVNNNAQTRPNAFKVNDILQIKKINHAHSLITCKNITTKEMVSIPVDSTTVFIPLVDPKIYTLQEIQQSFGFPAKIRFVDKKAERMLRTEPGHKEPLLFLSKLGQMTAMEEIQDVDVMVTIVSEDKVCQNVPKTLDIRVAVAEGFLSGNETYQKVVRTLDKELKRTDLNDFEDLDVYEHVNAVEKTIQEMSTQLSIEEASPEIANRAQAHLNNKASKSRLKNRFSFEKKPPSLPPKGQASMRVDTPPARPPKPGAKPARKGNFSPKIPAKIGDKVKGLKSSDWLNALGRKLGDVKSSSGDDHHERKHFPFDVKEETYAEPEKIYESIDSDDDDSENEDSPYTELDPNYIPTDPRPYQELPPPGRVTLSATPPPLPKSSPPRFGEESKAEIYQAIARYPKDLSGLSVKDVGKLLTYLGMEKYVNIFETELVDGSMLSSMDQEALESLDMTHFHVKKLLRFIGGWRPVV